MVLWLGWTTAGASTLDEQRQEFLAAERALAAGQSERFAELSAELTEYPLYPYLQYADLTSRLARADAKAVRRFLSDYADTPLAWQLRGRSLRLLAAKGVDKAPSYPDISTREKAWTVVQAFKGEGDQVKLLP